MRRRQEGPNCRMKEILVVALVVLNICRQVATSGSPVPYLPGFEGPLPFLLETGYIGVGQSEDVQVFYYFIQSEGNPKEDPLMLWISGGPGCSSFSGLIFEIGPLAFKVEEYKGGVPHLELRRHSWTKVCSIIFADLPVETGFSYSKTPNPPRGDYELIHHAHQFLRKWILEHPEYSSNQVFLGADSYSGIIIPPIFQEIYNGNERGIQPFINLQGYSLGNPSTTRKELDPSYRIPFAHGMGLISDELYMSWQKYCDSLEMDSRSELCLQIIDSFFKLISGIDHSYILAPKCETDDLLKPNEVSWMRRSLFENFQELFHFDSHHLTLPPLSCRTCPYFLSYYWANIDDARKALHVRKGSVGRWQRCKREKFVRDVIPNSFEYHANISKKGYRSLIYNGDHDSLVTSLATQEWIRSLNYSIVDDWRPWLVKGQVAG